MLRIFVCCCILSLFLSGSNKIPVTAANLENNPNEAKGSLTYFCDDTSYRELEKKIEAIRGFAEDYRFRIDSSMLRMTEKLESINVSLEYITKLLEEQRINSLHVSKPSPYNKFVGDYSKLETTQSATVLAPVLTPAPAPSPAPAIEDLPVAVKTVSTPTKPQNCVEALSSGGRTSGMYLLEVPNTTLKPFYAYCLADPDHGDAWMVIQRRQDNSTDFYRNWLDYKNGFGNLNGEFFLGLEKLHQLTYVQPNELWIKLEDFDGNVRHAKYATFAVNDESDKYSLNALGTYSGDAGDALSYHAGQKFTTKDNDNDDDKNNCAEYWKGAWWYKGCFHSNLNGRYLKGNYTGQNDVRGIVWNKWHNDYYSLKYVHMAIRPGKH